jgi:hypothetical protein
VGEAVREFTWKEFKDYVESHGVQDDWRVDYIDIGCPPDGASGEVIVDYEDLSDTVRQFWVLQ